METSTAVVLGLMVLAVVLFVSDRLRSDMVAMIILGALLVTGIITPEEGFSGFGHPATVAVAAMLTVVSLVISLSLMTVMSGSSTEMRSATSVVSS